MQEILTVQELADYLKMKPGTVRHKARKGEIPAFKLDRQFRFDKEQVDRWLSNRMVGRSSHILVVDDEPLVGQLFKGSLEGTGYQVTTTLSSIEALELIGKRHFDLIFLDLLIPEIDGAELFRRIRQTDKKVPVAIITGYPDSDLMSRAMEHGPFTVLKKPFTGDEILNTVRNFVERLATRKA